ncbi:MAG: type II toxin-antitoxin system RelE/ParE family toxin [Euryarchaeota archaeon]|nr:type II toxin-antitoxin system RelE/ParE family toxin [Euryarchaeota archaeon]
MYNVLINKDAQKYVDLLTEKSRRLVKKKLEMLKDNPHPGRADRKKLQLPNYDPFRMHVSRSYTIFYRIYEEEKTVKVLNIMTIEEAHKKYGML